MGVSAEMSARAPERVAEDLRIQYVTTLLDPDLSPDAAAEIARRTERALVDWMEEHPHLQVPNGDGSHILDS